MKRKIMTTLLCLAITVFMVACRNKENSAETNSIVDVSESIETEVAAAETDNMTEILEDDSIVYETDSIEDTMALIDSYGTNGIDNYSVLKYQFYTDTITDTGAYYTVKCDIYRPVRVDNGLLIGEMVEITTDETKNETHKLIYETENYLVDKDTGVKYYYNPSDDASDDDRKITLFKYEETYNEYSDNANFFSENEVLCKIYTGVIKLNKMAEVIDDMDDITGLITMENIAKSDGWFNQVSFNDDGEAMWICDVSIIYGSNRTY